MSTLPGQSSHGIPGQARYEIPERLAALERQIKTQQTANPLQATTIDEGGLTILNADGQTIAQIGNFAGDGIAIYRDDGTLALSLYSGFVAIWDRSGNYVVTDDTVSGQGLARPYLSAGTWTDEAVTAFTTASSWTTLQTVEMRKTHPKIEGQLLLRATDPNTTGEVRIQKVSDGSQVGDAQEIGAGANIYVPFGPYDLPGGNLERITLNLQCRRTGGSGQVGVRGISIRCIESNPV